MAVSERIRLFQMMSMQLAGKFVSDNALFLAAGLAFNLLLYSIPLALLLVTVLGYTVLQSEQALREVQSMLRDFLPLSQHTFADNLAEVVTSRGLLGLMGCVSFFVFSSFLFGSVRIVLNQVFEVRRRRTFFRGLGTDLLMMLFTAALALMAIGMTGLVSIVHAAADRLPALAFVLQPTWSAVAKMLGLIITTAVFYVLYRFPPARTLSSHALMLGAVTGTVLFELAKWAFAWYVAFAETTLALYGVLSGLLFFFVWLYYASVVFVLGAEIAWAYETLSLKS